MHKGNRDSILNDRIDWGVFSFILSFPTADLSIRMAASPPATRLYVASSLQMDLARRLPSAT